MVRRATIPMIWDKNVSQNDLVNWFSALKGSFKGKGAQWLRQIDAELEEIHGQMQRLRATTLNVEDHRIYLELHKRGTQTKVPGLALRWRSINAGRHAHVLWKDVMPIIERMPPVTRDWYGQLHLQADWLNAREHALAYERRTATTYLASLNRHEEGLQ